MNYKQLLKETWKIVNKYKIVWLFSLIYVFIYMLPMRRSNSLALLCVMFIFNGLAIIGWLFAEVGLISTVNNAISGDKTTLKDAWFTFKAKWLQILIIYLFLVVFIVPFICLLINFRYTQFPLWRNFFLAMIISISYPFALRGNVIKGLKGSVSIKRGISLSLRNLGPVLIIGLSFYFIRISIGGLPGVIINFLAFPFESTLFTLMYLQFSTSEDFST